MLQYINNFGDLYGIKKKKYLPTLHKYLVIYLLTFGAILLLGSLFLLLMLFVSICDVNLTAESCQPHNYPELIILVFFFHSSILGIGFTTILIFEIKLSINFVSFWKKHSEWERNNSTNPDD